MNRESKNGQLRQSSSSTRGERKAKRGELGGKHAHEIHLGQHSDRPLSVRIDSSSELETVRVGQIGVGSGDGENDSVGFGDELEEHISNLLLDVSRLISDGDLGKRRSRREEESSQRERGW